MINGVITRFNCGLFFLFKKRHYCQCGEVLERKKREVIVNSKSEEAKNYDFEVVDQCLHGNVKFITYYFECPNCRKVYEIGELKKIEKTQKNKK